MEVQMRTATIIILSILLMTLPNKAKACNGDCAGLALIILGIPTALTSTIIFPLTGLAFYGGENPPYWEAVGYTFLASTAGAGIAYLGYDDISAFPGDPEVYIIVLPLLFGAVATYLTYHNAPRQTDKSTRALWQYAPQVSVSPVTRGGSIRLNWSF